ncbi:MAG: PTS sugar transporter [Actinomycetaceae bacterium]|nr:PTS sugar transporter [Actinomycetaceae bacterium]
MSHNIDTYIDALGGAANIREVESYISRICVGVDDYGLIDEAALRANGALAVVTQRENVQIVAGDQACKITQAMQDRTGLARRCQAGRIC